MPQRSVMWVQHPFEVKDREFVQFDEHIPLLTPQLCLLQLAQRYQVSQWVLE